MNRILVNAWACSVCMLLIFSQQTIAQNSDSTVINFRARNSVYLEVGGTSIVYSLNYDRLFRNREGWKLGGRVGFAFLNLSFYDSRLVGELYALKPLKNRRDRFIELGVGALYRAPRLIDETPRTTDVPTIGLTPRIGLRWQPLDAGTVVRIGLTPIFILEKGSQVRVTPWAGFAIGRSFGKR